MSALTARFEVSTYEGDLRDIQGEIIEADWDLIGLGLMDLTWDEFVSYLIQERGYDRFSYSPVGSAFSSRYAVDVWKPVLVEVDQLEAVAS